MPFATNTIIKIPIIMYTMTAKKNKIICMVSDMKSIILLRPMLPAFR